MMVGRISECFKLKSIKTFLYIAEVSTKISIFVKI